MENKFLPRTVLRSFFNKLERNLMQSNQKIGKNTRQFQDIGTNYQTMLEYWDILLELVPIVKQSLLDNIRILGQTILGYWDTALNNVRVLTM